MTSLPARTFGLALKGRLAEGYDADLVVFDPDTVNDRATYEDPDLKPEGIPWVIVNGAVAMEEGESTRAASGQVLRRPPEPAMRC